MENSHIINVAKNVILEESDKEKAGSRLGKENSVSEKNVGHYLTLQFQL